MTYRCNVVKIYEHFFDGTVGQLLHQVDVFVFGPFLGSSLLSPTLLLGVVILVHEVILITEVILVDADLADGVRDGVLRGGLEAL